MEANPSCVGAVALFAARYMRSSVTLGCASDPCATRTLGVVPPAPLRPRDLRPSGVQSSGGRATAVRPLLDDDPALDDPTDDPPAELLDPDEPFADDGA